MLRKKINFVYIAKLLVLVIFTVGILAILLFPFENRDLNLQFITEEGKYEITGPNYVINKNGLQNLRFEQVDTLNLKELRIYGQVKSIYLKKIRYNEFAEYISNVQEGEVKWGENKLLILGNENIQLTMSDSFSTMLKNISSSLLLERIIMLELFGVIIAVLWIFIKVAEEKAYVDNRNNHSPIYEMKKFFKDVKTYWQYTVYAAKTDLKAEVANSYLNRLWWLLEPLFNMLVYVIVFGQVMGRSIENYATFTFSALLMWSFFNKTVNYSVKLIRNNKDIVTKVYIPKFILLISNMILNMFKLFFSLIVLVIMLILFRIQIGFNIILVIPAYCVMILFSFGIGMILMHFGVYVDDLSYAISILLSMLMFLSGTFYEVMDTLSEPLNTLIICLNPVAIFIDTMRNALLYNEVSNLPLIGIWLVISVILCCVGVHIVYKNENSYVKVV